MHPNTPYWWLEKFCINHNLPFKGLHAFRHSFATQAILNAKVDDKTVRERFLIAKKLVDKLLKDKEKNRKNKEYTGTISDIYLAKNNKYELIIRPTINCPEIDNEDKVNLENILESYDGEELDIGSRVRYINA